MKCHSNVALCHTSESALLVMFVHTNKEFDSILTSARYVQKLSKG